MKPVPSSAKLAAVTAGAAAMLGLFPGCNRQDTSTATATTPAPTTTTETAAATPTSEVMVEQAPPPPQQEVVEARPGPDYVWVAGYWGWHGNRHEWVRGRWERPPQGRHDWVQPRWEHRGQRYAFVPGHWN